MFYQNNYGAENVAYLNESSRFGGWVKWAALGCCCCLILTAIIAIPLGLIPVYLNGMNILIIKKKTLKNK